MLRAAISFFVIAIIAGCLGFVGIEGAAVDIGRFLALIFLVLAVVSLIMGRGSLSGPSV